MMLIDYLQSKGGVLFRLRSFTPLLLVPLFFLERRHFAYPRGSHTMDEWFEIGCLVTIVLGECIRIVTIGYIPSGTSGRNTKSQKAATLNTTGLYSVMRNPLYVGNFLTILGLSLLSQSWELIVLNSFFFMAAYVPIIFVEEQFLANTFGQAYRSYASRVPCFFPRWSLWTPPNRPWSWRMVLRREHDTIMSLILAFVILAQFRDYMITGAFTPDWDVLAILGATFLFWIVMKFLKKCTNLLRIQQEEVPAEANAVTITTPEKQ